MNESCNKDGNNISTISGTSSIDEIQEFVEEVSDIQTLENDLTTSTVDRYISKRLTKMELAAMRKSRKITQKQVSEATGLSIRCISDIENEDGGNPTLNNLIKYLDCMGYEISFQKKII